MAEIGMYNGLAQVVLKITAPGVPDFYQGTELWDFSLVDPDNRRPVDYALRERLLTDLRRVCDEASSDRRPLVQELLAARRDGRIKLYVTMEALHYRRLHAALFREGGYIPLQSGGVHGDRVCGFARIRGNESLVTVVPRLIYGLLPDVGVPPMGPDVWKDTWMAVDAEARRYRNILTGEALTMSPIGGRSALPLADVFRDCPVALLERIAYWRHRARTATRPGSEARRTSVSTAAIRFGTGWCRTSRGLPWPWHLWRAPPSVAAPPSWPAPGKARDTGAARRVKKEGWMDTDDRHRGGCVGTLSLAFVLGVVFGSGMALLLTPDSGSRMRLRLRQGAKTAQEEFADVAIEAREALGALGKDARQTIRQTASRLGAALGATKQALR
ncbi:MAG: hypothetical protein ACREVJ_11890, partial [Gammaproteobacteria bacterium]